MNLASITELLDYLYRFTVTFIIVLCGSIVKKYLGNRTNEKISIGKIIAASFVTTIVIGAAGLSFKMDFAVFVLLALIGGIWSMNIASFIVSSKFWTVFIPKLLSSISNPITKSIAETMEENNKKKNNTSKKRKTTTRTKKQKSDKEED